jgi:hypothetical protein
MLGLARWLMTIQPVKGLEVKVATSGSGVIEFEATAEFHYEPDRRTWLYVELAEYTTEEVVWKGLYKPPKLSVSGPRLAPDCFTRVYVTPHERNLSALRFWRQDLRLPKQTIRHNLAPGVYWLIVGRVYQDLITLKGVTLEGPPHWEPGTRKVVIIEPPDKTGEER